MLRFTTVLTVVLLALSLFACSARRPTDDNVEVKGLDKKYSMFAWIESGKLADFIVGTKATRDREDGPYIPLEIAVANRSLKRLYITRESFVLIDELGNRYQCANPEELIANYDLLDWDRQLTELPGIVDTRFGAYTRYPAKFSPTREIRTSSAGVITDYVSLPKFGYFIDFIYFPLPKTGLKGKKFELFLSSPDLPDPIFVKFLVE